MSTFTHDPLRHPWFASTSLKRKHSESSDDEDAPPSRPHAFVLSPSSSFDNLRGDVDIDIGAGPAILPTPPPERAELAYGRWNEAPDAEHDKKRRRYDMIESKMAHMQLHQNDGQAESLNGGRAQPTQPAFTNVSAPPLCQTFSASSTGSSDGVDSASLGYPYVSHSPLIASGSVLFDQYAVEEPPSPLFGDPIPLPTPDGPSIQEVRMRGLEPAWYEREKDRIVITDLDEVVAQLEAEEEAAKKKPVVDEDEYKSEAEPHPDFAEFADSNVDFSISNALLEHLLRASPRQPKANQGALILYRPPPITSLPPDFGWGSAQMDQMASDERGGGEGAVGYGGYGDEYDMQLGHGVSNSAVQDDDAMDVEP